MPTINPQSPETGTREQLETLARWMGWEVGAEVGVRGEARFGWYFSKRGQGGRLIRAEGGDWNPWTDANAAEQLMERARTKGWGVRVEPDRRPPASQAWFASVVMERGFPFEVWAPTPKEAVASAIYAAVRTQEEQHGND